MTWGNFKEDSVSETYKKMKAEELKGNQHKLDANKNGKLDSDDFKKLRKEEVEELDEAGQRRGLHGEPEFVGIPGPAKGTKPSPKAITKGSDREYYKAPGLGGTTVTKWRKKTTTEEVEEGVNKSDVPAYKRKDDKLTLADLEKERTQNKSHAVQLAKNNGTMKKEETELVEYEAKDGVYKHQAKAGRYGGSEKESDYVKGPSDSELKKIEAEKKKKVKEDLDIFSEKEIDSLINEVLKASDDAGKWISDFTKSDDPRFKGDSKEQRKKRALAAYYAAQKKESVDYDSFLEEAAQGDIVKTGAKSIKHDNIKDKQDEQDVMEPNSEGEADFLDKHSVQVTDEPAAAAGNDQTGKSKVSAATGPKGQGAGKYDSKGKTGVKEDTSEDNISEAKAKSCGCKEDCSCDDKAESKKSYTTFKEKMNKKGC